MATGLLVVLFGNALKLVPYYQKGAKRYTATVAFGRATDTYDAEGKTTAEGPTPRDLASLVEGALSAFTGAIRQTIPRFSAVKVDGRRLYDLARKGREVELPEREVRIDSLAIVGVSGSMVTLEVCCSSGTYIRSLANDLGAVVGAPAHLSALRRTFSAPFGVSEAITVDSILAGPPGPGGVALIRPESRLPDLPVRRLSPDEEVAVRCGRRIPLGAVDRTSIGPITAGQSSVTGSGNDDVRGAILLLSQTSVLVGIGTADLAEIRVKRVVDT